MPMPMSTNELDGKEVKKDTLKSKTVVIVLGILKNIKKKALTFFKYMGLATVKVFFLIRKYAKKFIAFCQKKYEDRKKSGKHSVVLSGIKKFFLNITDRFKAFGCFFARGGKALKTAYNSQTNFFKKVVAIFACIGRGLKNNTFIFKTILNYAVPTVAAIALVFLVNFVFSLTFAVNVKYNNVDVGYVKDEVVFNQAEQKLQSRMIYKESDKQINTVPVLKVEIVPKEKILTANELTNTMIMSSNQDIIEAEGITVDGVFLGATKEVGAIDEVLNELLNSKKTDGEIKSVKFAKDVVVETGLFIAQNIKDANEMTELLTSSQNSDVYYQIVPNDTPILIAKKNNMTLDELMAINPTVLKKCLIGDNVLVSKSKPFLPVSVTKTEVYNVAVPFQTQTTTSSQYASGYTKINKAGENGENIVTANVEYIDGIETSRDVTNTQVVKEPVDQQVVKGTGYFGSSSSGANNTPYDGPPSTGQFIWPVTGGYISQYFSRYHVAIDYAGRGNIYGKPIYAADDGRVVFAGSAGSYGLLIKVDHGNGLMTWYAHCSDISPVSGGKNVKQGEIIGKVGATGNARGAHLHFEVTEYGVKKNPLNYLP